MSRSHETRSNVTDNVTDKEEENTYQYSHIHDMIDNILGLKFGRLQVIKQEGNYKNGIRLYLCQCECGNTCTTSKCHLKQGAVKSCGCLSKQTASINGKKSLINIENKKFGLLTVLKVEKTSKHGAYWLCKCDCGKEAIVLGVNLRRGITNSCGCFASLKTSTRNKLKRSKKPWQVDMYHYKLAAERRGILFNLNEEDFKNLTSTNCYYCGREPSALCYAAELRETETLRSGIDRVDSSKNYDLNNCVPCCKYCNIEKLDQSLNQFILNTKLRYEHLKSKGLI